MFFSFKKFSISLLLLVCVSCGDDPSPEQEKVVLEQYLGAYRPVGANTFESCFEYLNFGKGSSSYWVDPDGVESGLDEFIVSCDMDSGGYATFEANPTPSFPLTNQSDTTITFFGGVDLQRINAYRAVADEVLAESDLTIEFSSDTTAGGCGSAPLIVEDTMYAKTLPLMNGSDSTETTRKFYGSSDAVDVIFDAASNEFVGSRNHACADTIIDRFGTGEKVIVTELLLYNQHIRAFSRVSGSYYRLKIK